MNWAVRNLIVVLFGAVTSILTAALLVYIEARTGQALFGNVLWTYVPLGAIAAGFAGAVGYLAGSLLVRVRPALLLLPVLIAIAAGTVYSVQSAEIEVMMAGPVLATNPASFGRFLVNSVVHSPLQFGSASHGSSSVSSTAGGSSASEPAAPTLRIANDSNASVQGMAGGLQNMVSAADPSKLAAQSRPLNQMNHLADDIGEIGTGVVVNSSRLELLGLQTAGFLLGALVVFGFLRSSFVYCDDCSLFLSKTGAQTRYFAREHEIKSSVEAFMALAKARQLQESIEEHFGKGTGEKKDFTDYASTIEVRRCQGCERHSLNFTARRKTKGSWKDIPVLGYATSIGEPLHIG